MKYYLFPLVCKFDSIIIGIDGVTAGLVVEFSFGRSETFYFPPKSEHRSRDYKSGQTYKSI